MGMVKTNRAYYVIFVNTISSQIMAELNNDSICFLTGKEQFTINGESIGYSVEDYWRFQFSNIWDAQEEVAEFIVSKALGIDIPRNKNGWTLWDINYRGKRIEVKETGYYHSWRSDGEVSKRRTFGINKAYSSYQDSDSELKRQSDIYVFCLNTGTTKEESNPLALEHWEFYVVSTSTINKLCNNNKTISLGRLRKITNKDNGISFCELKSVIESMIDSGLTSS